MTLGDVTTWASRFLSTDERFLERIAFVWGACLAVLPVQPEEDIITINLVHHLSRDPIVRRLCHWVEFQYEPFGTSPTDLKFSKGKIDLAVLLDWERERYLAYECKRLNASYSGGRHSLATQYVKDGMMRFMTEQYAEGLPVAGMLGYVLDGDIAFAIGQITSATQSHPALNLTSGPTSVPSISSIQRFYTRHNRPSMPIEIRHALMPF